MTRGRRALPVVVLAAALAAPAPAAQALTRADYTAEADAICKTQSQKQFRSLKAFKDKLRRSGLDGDEKFLRLQGRAQILLGRAIESSLRLLSALPPPPGDATVLAQWLDSLRFDAVNARAVARTALRRHVRFGVFVRAIDIQFAHARATELLVDGFGFTLCATPTYYSPVVSAGSFP